MESMVPPGKIILNHFDIFGSISAERLHKITKASEAFLLSMIMSNYAIKKSNYTYVVQLAIRILL